MKMIMMKQKCRLWIRRISVIALLLVLSVFLPGCHAESHTILIYILGSDLERDSGSATNDLMEITRATKETPVKVIAYLGGCTTWWMPGLESSHCYAVEIEQGNRRILYDYGQLTSSDTEPFASFMTEYGHNGDDLIIWGHGLPGGKGIGSDITADNDSLSLAEIQTGLEICGLKLRLVGFDACKMATLEAAWIVLPYAAYFAASTEEEALSGWNYRDTLSVLNAPEKNAPEKLRSQAIRGNSGNILRKTLTVLNLADCENQAAILCRVLDTAPLFSTPVLLNELAESCQDREAGEVIQRLLDGQHLLVSGMEREDRFVLPGIQDAYIAFANRE